MDEAAFARGELTTHVALPVSPLSFTRTIRLRGPEVQVAYSLASRSSVDEEFLWAMHPLLSLDRDDQLELTDETRVVLAGEDWLDRPDFAGRFRHAPGSLLACSAERALVP